MATFLIPGNTAATANPDIHITIRRALAIVLSHQNSRRVGNISSSKRGHDGLVAGSQVGLDPIILATTCFCLFYEHLVWPVLAQRPPNICQGSPTQKFCFINRGSSMQDCSKGYWRICHSDKLMVCPRGREDILGIRYRLLVPGKTGPQSNLASISLALSFNRKKVIRDSDSIIT